MTSKIELFEQCYERLKESNSLIQQANKTAFFFITFYKDFEEKVIYNSKIDKNSEIFQK
jgi:hypothetical protein